jgi:hypothetical protein
MTRRNRVDPWGDLHAVDARGMFTGNRGCLVDDAGTVVRHHGSSLWITCVTQFRGWQHPLDAPRVWTPIFFLDDAVALAAGHRPCALCRRDDYRSYRDAVTRAVGAGAPLSAADLNRRLHAERLPRGRGLDRAADRLLWKANIDDLPDGTVIVDDTRTPRLVLGDTLPAFSFDGWTAPMTRPEHGEVDVLTPSTSVAALGHGYVPRRDPLAEPGAACASGS